MSDVAEGGRHEIEGATAEVQGAVEDAAEAARAAETPEEQDHWTSVHAELTAIRTALEQLSLRAEREVAEPAETGGETAAEETPVVVAVTPAAEPTGGGRPRRRRKRLI